MTARSVSLIALITVTALMPPDRLRAQAANDASSTGLIVGQVVDADTGRAVSGAVVTISGTTTAFREGSAVIAGASAQPRILTSPDGYFVFRDLPPGSYSLQASKPGYAEGALGRRRPGGPSHQQTLAKGQRVGMLLVPIWKLGAITGRVVDEAGEALIGVQVRACRLMEGPGHRQYSSLSATLTNDLGMYRLSNLLPGQYVVLVPSRQVAVPLSLAQQPLAGGLPPGFAEVGLGAPASSLPGSPYAIQTGDVAFAVGRSAAVPPPPSDGRRFIYPPTFHPSAQSISEAVPITLPSGEERAGIDLHLIPVRGIRVSGVLTGPDDVRGGMPIRLLPATEEVYFADVTPATISAGDGAFMFPGVPPGEYVLRTVTPTSNPVQPSDGPWWAEGPISVGADDVDGLAIPLQRGVRISGRLEFEGTRNGPTAAELQRVQMLIEPATEPSLSTPAVHIDSTGQFTSAGLRGGRYSVQVGASPEGWMFLSARHDGVDVSESPLAAFADVNGITLTFTDRWSSLRGVVQEARGNVDPNATVLLFPVDAQQWFNVGRRSRRVRSARTTPEGEYRFPSLPPGDYYVVAVADEEAADWRDATFIETLAAVAARVTVLDGQHTMQTLRTRRP